MTIANDRKQSYNTFRNNEMYLVCARIFPVINIFSVFQGINFYTETKTVTSLWRADDAGAGRAATVMPTPK